ncbi:guanylate cyclase beta [Calliphora vicina]|uniref:guanylate cyclase beta n=1 Tax=Calliphora vicina TaxID=7373 RepID=UPI00325AD725
MYSLNLIIVIIKLLVIMDVEAAPTSSLTNSVINSAKDINQQLTQPQQQQPTAALSAIASSATTSPASVSATASTNTLRLRKRHRKRHSIWSDFYNYNENSTMLEWSNPCGGEYHPNARQLKRPNRKEQKRIYNNLRHTALNDFNYLNGSHQQDIDISNIEIWWLHNGTYKFLPKLKINSSIALKRWYRNMQTYVASFAYLYRIQFKYDRSKSQRESNTSHELKELLKSSRNMLCELETAVNKTYPAKTKQIPQITRLEMNKRLKLRTKQRFRDNANLLAETDSIDLKFVKFHYFEYLKSMWQLLRKFNKRKGQVALPSGSSTKRQLKQKPETNNQQQFNEVEKSLNKNQTKHSKYTALLDVMLCFAMRENHQHRCRRRSRHRHHGATSTSHNDNNEKHHIIQPCNKSTQPFSL